jgi:hypothetical protein
MKRFAMLFLAALPMLAQSATQPVAQIAPLYPREGQPVFIAWIQTVNASVNFGKPTVVVSPGLPHAVTISQTATPQGFAAESVDQQAVMVFPREAGPYTVTLELTIGSAKSTFGLGSFVVAPSCSSVPSASATYSWEKSGYELVFGDSVNGSVSTGPPALVSIEGNHVTVGQSLTIGGIPPLFRMCYSSKVDLGAIAPGTYRLTWIYDVFVAPESVQSAGNGQPLTRELTFEAQLPRRRTTR